MTTRQNRILAMAAENSALGVSVLAKNLGVSLAVLRRDLDYLEDLGLVQQKEGFVLFRSMDDMNIRMTINHDIKQRIAKTAAEMVEEGETVMIESGSCCALLAAELASQKRVTIITNSAFIAGHIRHAPYANVILLGGEYQNGSQVMVGTMTGKWSEIFMSEKFFIGADGFTEKYGFTGRDHLRTQTARDMARRAQQVIVLTDSDTFFRQGTEGLVKTEHVAAVFTDDRLPPAKEAFLQNKNVAVHKVPARCPAAGHPAP
ncbi:MAG: DeoR/GlpR family DNA-binding transcription regulator [Treponema sp.]|jgi:DeoR/GlpR family transcriptional regulator of sugar metabolism|nr:DeoR/GlpR family DNA-binding transcription regulator [Treponema sp.]